MWRPRTIIPHIQLDFLDNLKFVGVLADTPRSFAQNPTSVPFQVYTLMLSLTLNSNVILNRDDRRSMIVFSPEPQRNVMRNVHSVEIQQKMCMYL